MPFPWIPQRFKMAVRHAIMSTGIDLYQHTDDRRVLESVILPYCGGRPDFRKILFVGCGWYTRGYRRYFPARKFWTLDVDPAKGRYGSRHHITGSLTDIGSHFREGELDLIICNGVFGWGLNARPDVERAFRGCHACLRTDGIFILGWNNVPERRPFDPRQSESLGLFRPFVFPALGASRHLTDTPNRHTYNFYLR